MKSKYLTLYPTQVILDCLFSAFDTVKSFEVLSDNCLWHKSICCCHLTAGNRTRVFNINDAWIAHAV